MAGGTKRPAEEPVQAPDVKRAMLEKALAAVKAKARSAVGRAQALGKGGSTPTQAIPAAVSPSLLPTPTMPPASITTTTASPATMTLQQTVQARLASMRKKGVLTHVGGTQSPMPQPLGQGPVTSMLGQDQQALTPQQRLQLLKDRVGKVQETMAKQSSSRNVTMTADGRFIDAETGEEVEVKRREAQFSVNKRHEEGTATPAPEQKQRDEDDDARGLIDENAIRVKASQRRSRNLNFRERGFHIEYAHRLRKRAELEALEQQVKERSKRVGLEEGGATSSLLMAAKPALKTRGVPTIEWWDSVLLPGHVHMNDIDAITEWPQLTTLIEHPVLIQPHKPHVTRVMPVMRTRKERKKEQRVRRREEHLDKQERIRLRLEPPPPPKLKLSNLMRILADETVQDPTKMEAEVRRQVAERKEKHLKANADRKLTTEERAAKKDKKLTEDTQYEVHSAAFWVKDMSHKLNKRKVDLNAQQYKLTGAVVMSPVGNLVVVEGGQKNVAKYTRLMMNRIQWNLLPRNDDDYDMYNDDDNEDEVSFTGKLVDLVWKGTSITRRFTKWFFRSCETEDEARRWLRDFEAENLWDCILTTAARIQHDEY